MIYTGNARYYAGNRYGVSAMLELDGGETLREGARTLTSVILNSVLPALAGRLRWSGNSGIDDRISVTCTPTRIRQGNLRMSCRTNPKRRSL
jgi:hypothetical protein